MKPVYEQWKAQISTLPRAEADFERWLFVQTAVVLFGDKAGELILLRDGQSELSVQERLQRLASLSRSWRFWCRVLHRSESCCKIVVYDRRRTQEHLARVPAWIFRRLGYPPHPDHGAFLSEIRRRWRATGRIPHEVGLVLGYPLKDVLGYMGLLPLRYVGGCGWRIYGNPSRSLSCSRRFRQARERAQAFVRQ